MIDTVDWTPLEAELAAWRAAGRVATLWWRDDDAGEATAPLRRLLSLAGRYHLPLALATVPAWAKPGLVEAVAGAGDVVTVLQHGYAHFSHTPLGEKKCELGPERPAAIVVAELAQGWQRLEELFGACFWPGMVPPWNRLGPHLVPYLAELRFRGLSQFGPRARRMPVRGLVQANTHVDIVFWKSQPARFAGAAKQIAAFVAHLAARRTGACDAAEPTGLLTHHASHDDACWEFLEQLFDRFGGHPALAWLPAAEVFADGERS
ncbi:MAG: polysaccharide deacetylase family protein [Rhodospirillaceae bacterium]|nr:polysaccharide deacetylase family protein [Rhodospirillaceae bacterium]